MEGVLYITDSNGNPNVLGLNRHDKGRWLNAYNGHADNRWNRENGFVFLAPKVFSFLPRSGGGVLFIPSVVEGFYNLSLPTAQHSTNLL